MNFGYNKVRPKFQLYISVSMNEGASACNQISGHVVIDVYMII